ncbi:MAG TPA: hypothetical protein VFC61_00565, partial [Blastocatellia bacterium]|nr:hypothetical protein [Blastocatellia bacterium]
MTTRTLLLLFVATLAVVCGVFNLRDRLNQKAVPTDGVVWEDHPGRGVVAARLDPDGPAARSGQIRSGDVLAGISIDGADFEEISRAQDVQIYLDHVKDQVGEGRPISYLVVRFNDAGDTRIKEGVADLDELAPRPSHPGRDLYLALLGLVYLGIGLYVVLRQGRAPYVTHFFLICLLAFIAHFYSATEELRTQFDKAVDVIDVLALILLAPAFVHFAAIYPARYHLFTRRRWLAPLLYLPALVLIVGEVWNRVAKLRALGGGSAVNLLGALERGAIILFALAMLLSCGLLLRTFWQARSPIVRQQLKWVVSGIGLAAVSFSAFYLPSFLAGGSVGSLLEAAAIAPFVFIPLTLGYSIVRYRLMDVDVVVRRSAAYIIATFSVAA